MASRMWPFTPGPLSPPNVAHVPTYLAIMTSPPDHHITETLIIITRKAFFKGNSSSGAVFVVCPDQIKSLLVLKQFWSTELYTVHIQSSWHVTLTSLNEIVTGVLHSTQSFSVSAASQRLSSFVPGFKTVTPTAGGFNANVRIYLIGDQPSQATYRRSNAAGLSTENFKTLSKHTF